MMFCTILFFLCISSFLLSSFHVLMILLFIELVVLCCVFYSFTLTFSWFFYVGVTMVGVILGAYGVSLLVSNSRSKGGSYFTSF